MLKLAGRGKVVNFNVWLEGQLAAKDLLELRDPNVDATDEKPKMKRNVNAKIAFFLCKYTALMPVTLHHFKRRGHAK